MIRYIIFDVKKLLFIINDILGAEEIKVSRLRVRSTREHDKFEYSFGGLKMVRPAWNRRHFLGASIATLAIASDGQGAHAKTLDEEIYIRPFAGSRTISSFAYGLYWSEEYMPPALSRAIDAELALTSQPVHDIAAERRQAEFFGWLAMRVIAPRTLRRAGYEALALGCERERDFRPGGAAACAQHTIGREFPSSRTPPLADVAYAASAHTSTCVFYAGHEDIEVVVGSGTYLARALLEPYAYGDLNAADSAWIWNFAVTTINVAADLCRGTSA